MKIILTTDVPKVGNRYEIKDFKNGYANLLISRGLAILATPQALSNLANKKVEGEKKKAEEMQNFDSLIASINNTKIEIKAKANEKGHLFKAVGPHDVVLSIKEITGVEIDEKFLIMDHIKSTGTYMVSIRKGDKKGECQIIVKAL